VALFAQNAGNDESGEAQWKLSWNQFRQKYYPDCISKAFKGAVGDFNAFGNLLLQALNDDRDGEEDPATDEASENEFSAEDYDSQQLHSSPSSGSQRFVYNESTPKRKPNPKHADEDLSADEMFSEDDDQMAEIDGWDTAEDHEVTVTHIDQETQLLQME
jgi:hypothetical protein